MRSRKSLKGILGILFLDLGLMLIINSVMDWIEER